MSRVSMLPKNFVATPLEQLPHDVHRTYLAVVAATDVTVILQTPNGQDMAPFVIAEGANWAPNPAPTNPIAFVGSGTLIRG